MAMHERDELEQAATSYDLMVKYTWNYNNNAEPAYFTRYIMKT